MARGHLILFFLTGNLDFQQAPGHRSRGFTTSHAGDCQKLPHTQKKRKKSTPESLWELLGRERTIRLGTTPGTVLGSSPPPSRPCYYLLGRPGPTSLPDFPPPPSRGLLQKELTGDRAAFAGRRSTKERRESIALHLQKAASALFSTPSLGGVRSSLNSPSE